MESRGDQGKRGRYDPSMSRRTRRPGAVAAVKASLDRDGELGMDGGDSRRPSLKDLLEGGGGEEGVVLTAANATEGKAASAEEEEEEGRPPANAGKLPRQEEEEEEEEEEKHLPMVRVRGPGGDGVKLAGMVTRCVKLLNHLVKARSTSKKKKTGIQFLK